MKPSVVLTNSPVDVLEELWEDELELELGVDEFCFDEVVERELDFEPVNAK